MIILNVLSTLQNHFLLINVEESGGDFFLVALVLWLITLFIARKFMMRHVLKEMNKVSSTEKSGEPEVLDAPEIKAKNKPKFVTLDDSMDRASAIELRESYVKRAFILFRRKYLYGIIACLLYFFLPMLFSKIGGIESQNIVNDQLSMVAGLAVFYFVYITLVYYFYRQQYRPEDTKFGVRIEHPAISLLRKIVNPQWESYFTLGLILIIISVGFFGISGNDEFGNPVKGETTIWTIIAYVMSAVIHFWMIYKIRQQNKQVSNVSLLILRVFGDKKQVLLTFGRLTEFWKHIGTWFTVVDPSFIGRKYRTFTFRTLFTLLLIFLLAILIGMNLGPYLVPIIEPLAGEGHASPAEIEEFAMIPGMLIAWFIYFKYWKYMISRSYAKDHQDISKKLSKVMNNPRNTDMTFKNLPMFCYDNTWKLAVSEFIKNSKVILMDLRGFSSERKGCQYEIDFLLDTFSINGILFLVDVSSDKELVQRTITERWEFLRVNSPNLKNEKPVAKIFISNKQNENEVQAIIDYLILTEHESN